MPIFYFNGPKCPPDNCYVTCLLREKSALVCTEDLWSLTPKKQNIGTTIIFQEDLENTPLNNLHTMCRLGNRATLENEVINKMHACNHPVASPHFLWVCTKASKILICLLYFTIDTSWGQSMSLSNLNEVSSFSWRCQLSYETLFV